MADIFTKEIRSNIMRQVKGSRNKSTELRLMKYFMTHSISGWRRNRPMKCKPDFVFPEKRIAVFVDGCFWHGHGCRNITPQDNKEYWLKKIATTKERDAKANKYLSSRNWLVIRIWECELTRKKEDLLAEKLKSLLLSHRPPFSKY